ncbi:MAG: hypothetical protein AAGC93_03770 [Cyanobacteria bacterium P01_F01_bin.53]
MNQNFNQLQVRFPGLGCWVFILGSAWLIGAIGLTGIIKASLVVILLLFLAPVMAFLALQFWVKRNLIEGNCPACEQSLTGLKNSKMPCVSCGTELSVTSEGFERFASDGVIDVQAVDIQASTVDLSDTSGTTIDVDVQRLPEADG